MTTHTPGEKITVIRLTTVPTERSQPRTVTLYGVTAEQREQREQHEASRKVTAAVYQVRQVRDAVRFGLWDTLSDERLRSALVDLRDELIEALPEREG
jgi:hypothetical protein